MRKANTYTNKHPHVSYFKESSNQDETVFVTFSNFYMKKHDYVSPISWLFKNYGIHFSHKFLNGSDGSSLKDSDIFVTVLMSQY